MIHFFGGAGSDDARVKDSFGNDVVADDIKLLLLFTLNVFTAGHAEHPHEGSAGYF